MKNEQTEIADVVSVFTLEKLLADLEFDLRVKEFVIVDIDKKNYSVSLNKPHRSEYFTIFIVQNGHLQFSLDENSFQVKKGDIVFSQTADTFKIEKISDDYQGKYIFFSLNFISEAGFNYKSNDVLKSLSSVPINIIRNETDIFQKIEFYLKQLHALNTKETDDYYFKEMIWHHFSLVIYEIDNYFKRTENSQDLSYREDEITTQFFTLVREHFKEQHNVQFYADQLYISRKYLTKVISKTMFKSPREIIQKVLTVEARLLLRNTGLNVNEVAEKLNFANQSSFSKFFKKNNGSSPISYKRDDLY